MTRSTRKSTQAPAKVIPPHIGPYYYSTFIGSSDTQVHNIGCRLFHDRVWSLEGPCRICTTIIKSIHENMFRTLLLINRQTDKQQLSDNLGRSNKPIPSPHRMWAGRCLRLENIKENPSYPVPVFNYVISADCYTNGAGASLDTLS